MLHERSQHLSPSLLSTLLYYTFVRNVIVMYGIPRGDDRLDRQRDFSYTPSRVGLDYTLSVFCIHAHFHLVSAPSPCHSRSKESERFGPFRE